MRAPRHRLLCLQEGGECELELVIHHELLQPQVPEQPKALPEVSSSLRGWCCSACTSMRPWGHSSVLLGANSLVTPFAAASQDNLQLQTAGLLLPGHAAALVVLPPLQKWCCSMLAPSLQRWQRVVPAHTLAFGALCGLGWHSAAESCRPCIPCRTWRFRCSRPQAWRCAW